MSGPGRILVIRGGAIGDFILTLPALSALKRTFPSVRVEVMTYNRVAGLAVEYGHADAAHSIESRAMAGFFAKGGGLDFELSRMFAECDVIFSYLYDPDEIFRINLARVSRAQVIQGIHRPDDSSAAHATEQLLKPLESLAIFDADPVPRLPVALDPTPGAAGEVWFAAHPGSSTEAKNWPRPFWSELLQRVIEVGNYRWMLLGGEAEGGRLHELARELPPGRVEILEGLPLSKLAAKLAGAAVFVGHDSGPTHLAAAVGIPGVALWKHTNPVVWGPRGNRFKIVHEGDAESVAATLVEMASSTVPADAVGRR